MNKLFVHFQVFQFPFKCIYFHEYFQPRVHEMSSFRTFKISFEELWSFLNFMNFFYDVIDPQVVQLSFQGKHDLSRERSRFIYFVWISHKGWGFAKKRVSETPHYNNPSQNLSHRTLDSALDKTLISHEQNQLTTLKYWLMKRLSLSLRALLEPYPDWWHQNNTRILNISSLLHT